MSSYTFVDYMDIKFQEVKPRQMQKTKIEVLEPKFRNIPYIVEGQKQYHRRQLNVKEIDKSKIIGNKINKRPNNFNGLKQLMEWFRGIWNSRSNSNRRQTERQGEFAAPFVLNSVGAGLAAVASLVGLVAVARTPFARVLSDASPVEQVPTGSYSN